MDRETTIALERLRTQLDRISARVPVRLSSLSSTVTDLWVQVVGGNPLTSGLESIKYAASVTPLAVYDPNVTTSYPTGLGNGWLFTNGLRSLSKVLIRHNFLGDQGPQIAGRIIAVNGTETLTYSGTNMTAYTTYWL